MMKRVCPLLFSVLLLSMTGHLLGGQESSTYQQEYDLYLKAQQETDPAKQQALCLEFVQKFKESDMDPHISYLYAQQYAVQKQQGSWQAMANAAEKYLQYRPSDQNSAAAATEAYQRLGQPQKLVQFGTRLYRQAPSGATAYLFAKAYQSMNDSANLQKWAELTMKHAPNNVEMAVELVNSYWKGANLEKAASYASRALKGLESSPQDQQTNQVRAFLHRAVGENAYISGDNADARRNFEAAVKYDPKVDFSHFRLGYCYWRAGDIDKAILSFARAVALKGSSSREARKELYSLLTQRYGNTSRASGIIEAARKELGVS